MSGPFAPTIDGPEGLFPESPLQLRLKGKAMKVNLIAGITMDEGAYLAGQWRWLRNSYAMSAVLLDII